VVQFAIHVQKSRNKRTNPSAYATTAFFGTINPLKNTDEKQQQFLRGFGVIYLQGLHALIHLQKYLALEVNVTLMPSCLFPFRSSLMDVVRIHIVIQHTSLTYQTHIHTQTHNMDESIHKYLCTTTENVTRKIYCHKTHDVNTYNQAKPTPFRESRLMLTRHHNLELH
jgi:hypothetical protein